MIPVWCRTNLDLHMEEWPNKMVAVPNVGDEIESRTVHRGGFRLKLQVVSVTWKYRSNLFNGHADGYYPEIELHMTKHQQGLMPVKSTTAVQGSVTAFYEWYARHVGSSVGSFI